MVTLRFTKVFILCMKAAPAIRFLPYLSTIDYRQLRACRCIHLLPTLVSTSRSSCAALFSQSSSIEASRCASVTILAARYRSLDGPGAQRIFSLSPFPSGPHLWARRPLGKKPKAKKNIIIKFNQTFREGTYVW